MVIQKHEKEELSQMNMKEYNQYLQRNIPKLKFNND